MKQIGLFEGIGGFSLAAEWMGWETIAWCEWNEFGQKVLSYHFPNAKPHGDIKTTDFTIYKGQCDIVTGGFPCQPYSQAGKRKGKEDDRHLWPEMLRAIREIQPSWVVGENVLGLVNWSGGLVFHEVQTDLEAAGYEVFPFVLPACAVNAPHRRDRVWFVAYSNSNGQHRRNGQHEIYTSEGREHALNDTNKIYVTTNANEFGQVGRCEQPISKEPNKYSELNSADATNYASKGLERGKRSTVNSEYNRGKNEQWHKDWVEVASKFCRLDDGIPRKLDGITFSKWRNESIKAYGNAIVPQVAFEIFKAIMDVHCQTKS